MRRTLLYSGLAAWFLIFIYLASQVYLTATLAEQAHPLAGWAVGVSLGALLFTTAAAAILILLAAVGPAGSLLTGSRRHRRYVARLAERHRRFPVAEMTGLPADGPALVRSIYERLEARTAALTTESAESIFFHTAISQSGRMDVVVGLGEQFRIVRKLARLYYPHAGIRILSRTYLAVAGAVLRPGSREEINPGAQIGPAIIGASVVGAIPGANLVSIIIADAVIQGSANALTVLRAGLVTRLYFEALLAGKPTEPNTLLQNANRESLALLSGLVTRASGVLSRAIWDAAKDSLRRIPAATYDSIKSLVSRSVQGLGRKKKEQPTAAEKPTGRRLPADD